MKIIGYSVRQRIDLNILKDGRNSAITQKETRQTYCRKLIKNRNEEIEGQLAGKTLSKFFWIIEREHNYAAS